MKNRKLLYIMLIIVLMLGVLFLVKRGTYSSTTESIYTRKQLQDMVVSTALSYYYNNAYTDYEQYAMDDYSTFNWRNLNTPPEMLSRSNVNNFDCSSFVNSVYLYSLGYDDSDYTVKKDDNNKYNIGSTFRTYNDVNKLARFSSAGSANYFQNNYLQCGLSEGTDIGKFINRNVLANKAEYFTSGNEWKYYLNETGENAPDERLNNVVFYYEVALKEEGLNAKVESLVLGTDVEIEEEDGDGTGNASNNEDENDTGTCNSDWYADCSEQAAIKKVIRNTLQPGDRIHVWRTTQDGSRIKGHIMLYVGDTLNKNGGRGFIHSTGSDFKINEDGSINLGDNSYNNSVRYDTWKYFMNEYLFRGETVNGATNDMLSFTVFITRPINEYCTDDNHCSLTKDDVRSRKYKDNYDLYLNNTNTRVDMRNLAVEQFQFKGSNTKDTINKYNSVNTGDVISYRVLLKNRSSFGYCQSGKFDNQTDCEATSLYSWSNKKCTDNVSTTKDECLATKLRWINSTRETIDYNNVLVTAKIPDGTTYVANSCRYQIHTSGGTNVTGNDACTYDDNTKTISWHRVDILNDDTNYHSFTYKVKPSNKKQEIINNEGMTVTLNNGNSLNLGKLTTRVNPTITGNNITKIQAAIDDRMNNPEANTYSDALAFISDVYNTSLGINLNDYLNSYSLSYKNIRDAIFKIVTDDEYLTIEPNVEQITNDTQFVKRIVFNNNQKLINNMLVPGAYGGRHLLSNVGLDRAIILFNKGYKSSLEVGDVIIAFDFTASGTNYYTWIFYGYDDNNQPIFVRFRNGNYNKYDETTSKTGYQIYKEIYAYDLFVTLRPSRILNADIEEVNNTYITNNTYSIEYNMNGAGIDSNLPTIGYMDDDVVIPHPSDKTVTWTFDGNNTNANINKDSLTFTQAFTGWSSNASKGLSSDALVYSERVNDFIGWDGTKNKNMHFKNLADQRSTVTLTANWKTSDAVQMPTVEKEGYTCFWSGNKAGTSSTRANSSELRNPSNGASANYTWYAHCDANNYNVVFNANNGIGEMESITATYDSEFTLPASTFTRTDYTFIGWNTEANGTGTSYNDKEKVKNLTLNDTITLYAQWGSPLLLSVSDDLLLNRQTGIIGNVTNNSSITSFIDKITIDGEIQLLNHSKEIVTDRNIVRGGDYVRIIKGNEIEEYMIIISGDVNQDFSVDSHDLTIMAKYIIDKSSDLVYNDLLLGDINHDGVIKMNDIIIILLESMS